MANLVPDSIVCAARVGDAETVRQWLESGGDPNWNLVDPNSHYFPSHYRLLMFTAEWNLRDVMRVLISHGADVKYEYTYIYPEGESSADSSDEEDCTWRALDMALYKGNDKAAQLLIDNGADVSRLNFRAWDETLAHSRLLRIVLAAGADFTAPCVDGQTPEVSVQESLSRLRLYYAAHSRIAMYEETLSILEGVRLAGSYKQYVLRDFKGLLRTRSLLARGRALLGPQTPDVVARLFGGRKYRFARQRRPLRPAGVPDPAFWLVMEYWRLGNWRRP